MMHSSEIQPIQELANVVATLLNTGHPQAVDAAMPILAMIKAQFPGAETGETQVCQQLDGANGQAEPAKRDPVAEAVEELRLAKKKTEDRDAEATTARRQHDKAVRLLEYAGEAERFAQSKLNDAIIASNRA